MASIIWVIITLAAIVLKIDAKPSCRTVGVHQKDIVCNADNTDYVLSRGLVSDNTKTTGITLRECRISDIDYEAFKALPSLEYLDLSINKIQRLKLGVLDETQQVKFLNLSYNLIPKLPLGLFDQEPNLEILDLKGNRINSLELGIFDSLSKLKHLDLSSNAIRGKDLDHRIFDNSIQIGFLDFSRNDMTGSSDNLLHALRAVNFLNLDRCLLKEVPKFATIANLANMHHLMLSTNEINKIDDPATFNNLENLKILNLAENVIESVNEDVFKPLRQLQMIILRNNKLKMLPDTLFRSMTMLNNIDLSHNIIEFVPVNAFRGTGVKNLNLADNRFTYLTNNFCLELRNSGARLRKFFFNQNPWQCGCLRELLNEVKSMGVEYNSAKYNGKETVCVTTREHYCKRHQNFNKFYVDMYYNNV